MRWADVNTKGKLYISCFVPLMIMVIGGIWLYFSSQSAIDSARAVSSERLVISAWSNQMRMDVIQIQQWLTDISATRGLDGLDDGRIGARPPDPLFFHRFDQGCFCVSRGRRSCFHLQIHLNEFQILSHYKRRQADLPVIVVIPAFFVQSRETWKEDSLTRNG